MLERSLRQQSLLLAMLMLTLALASCAHGTANSPSRGFVSVPIGDSTQTIMVNNLTRTFHLYRPASLMNPASLVVMLHGGFGSGAQAEKSYHWDTEADIGHFLVVYPDGIDRAWNTGGGCCGQPASQNIDDVGFLTQMVTTLEHEVAIDPNRVFVTGISNGGIMAYTLACQTDVFAAIGPDSATQLGPCSNPKPISVIHIHGTADKNIPYNGGNGDGVAHIDGPSVPALNATWRAIDACGTSSITKAGVVTTSVASCPGGRTVELITIEGAGHQWPGGVSDPLVQRLLGTDPPSQALNATQVIWQFFSQHGK